MAGKLEERVKDIIVEQLVVIKRRHLVTGIETGLVKRDHVGEFRSGDIRAVQNFVAVGHRGIGCFHCVKPRG